MAFELVAQDETEKMNIVHEIIAQKHGLLEEDREESQCLTCARTATVSLWKTTFGDLVPASSPHTKTVEFEFPAMPKSKGSCSSCSSAELEMFAHFTEHLFHPNRSWFFCTMPEKCDDSQSQASCCALLVLTRGIWIETDVFLVCNNGQSRAQLFVNNIFVASPYIACSAPFNGCRCNLDLSIVGCGIPGS